MRRCVSLLTAILWLCLPLFAGGQDVLPETAPETPQVSRALLVGCDRFVSQMDTAPSSANNVRRMSEALSGGSLELAALEARPEGVTTANDLAALVLDTFEGADDNDVSIFYISTHGVWEERAGSGGMTLLLSDGETESGVTAQQLRTMFDQIPGRKVLLLDACHAGAMIGKGVSVQMDNIFAGGDYVVICSSGGAEESWYWSGDIDGERLAGAGYFSGALVRALSVDGNYGADDNRGGVITLTEVKRYLLDHHGASTVRTYPERSDLPVFTYDVQAHTGRSRDAVIENVVFESDVLSDEEPTVYFSFNVVRSVQVAYQLVYDRGGRWDFDNAQIIYDNSGYFGAWPMPGRTLSPGMKERAITIDRADAGDSGYVLLQLMTIDRGVPAVVASHLLAVPPESGDPALAFSIPQDFRPAAQEELTFIVQHAVPCELTVTVQDMEGNTVCRLASRQASRPEQLSPGGTTFTWDGLTTRLEACPPGQYRISVRAYVGDERYEALSEPFLLTEPVG